MSFDLIGDDAFLCIVKMNEATAVVLQQEDKSAHAATNGKYCNRLLTGLLFHSHSRLEPSPK